MKELLDFGGGALSGAELGAKVSGGNPWVTGGSALGMGLISLFGNQDQNQMENTYNNQQLELGKFDLADRKREERLQRQKDRKMKMFSSAFSQYLTAPSPTAGAV